MKKLLKILPWFFVALFATEIIAVVAPKPDGTFHLREFGRLPVLLKGRVQPFDSAARNSLLQIRSTADVPLEIVPSWQFWHHPKKLKSTEWLLEVMTKSKQADERPIFLISHPDLLSELKLGDKGVENHGLRYYTFNELKPVLPEIFDQGHKAGLVDEAVRTPLQRQVLKLQNAVGLFGALQRVLHPQGAEDFAVDLETAIAPGVEAFQAKEDNKPFDQKAYDRMYEIASGFDSIKKDPFTGETTPLMIPPAQPEVSRDDWHNLGQGVMDSIMAREVFPPVHWLAAAAAGFANNDPVSFNEAVSDYTHWLGVKLPVELAKGRHEFFFNDMKPFLHAIIIYIFALVLTGASLLLLGVSPEWSETFRRSALYIIMLAWLVHTFGLIFRMVLEGRPPVTNLYSSAIFIGWGAVILGMILERVYRIGIGNGVASVAGFVTLLIAHNLALGGDTMEMLRAVLDTNFWLATHVVVVTLGYASTFVAGLLAVYYVVLGIFTPLLRQKVGERTLSGAVAIGVTTGAIIGGVPGAMAGGMIARKVSGAAKKGPDGITVGAALGKMVYGIVCFATLFSFVGTVLGGIWADQSWGRFWGWDPKENGALLIVIWNATILHARWGGMIRERGLMNMAIFGNIVTSFSWFGVNELGIGLHSYGFSDAAATWLYIFDGAMVALIILGLSPRTWWRSFRDETPKPPATPGDQGSKDTSVISAGMKIDALFK